MTSQTIDILSEARKLKETLVAMRRHIHSNPELSFLESQTADFVVSKLKPLGYQIRANIGGTGVLADIGDSQSKIGIRADMDALPIQEENPHDYCSKNKGVMHACGHDVHTASALGAAMILSDLKKQGKLEGSYRFLFQPAEETVNEDGLSGASLMMREGCLDDLKALIAIHVHPGMPTGILGFREGTFLAACDSFTLTVKGKGGHGAYPEDTVDAVVLACNLVQTLQTLISRRKSALSPAVLTIGGIKSNTYRPNIIADSVELVGTVRYFEEGLSEFFEAEIIKAGKMLEPYGASLQLEYRRENPSLINNADVNSSLKDTAREMIGPDRVLDLPMELGAEDFSFYSRKIPSVFAIVGCGIEGSPREIHTSTFDIDEDALVYGSALLAASAISLAKKHN